MARSPLRRRLAPPAALLVGFALALGCGEDAGLEFEAPSEQEMRDRVYQEPTATLDAATLPWVFEQAIYAASFATAFVRFTSLYAETLTAVGDPETTTGPLVTTRQALRYEASGYVRFSCPGPDLETPDFEFGSGEARIDSPGLTGTDERPAFVAGSVFLLQFRDGCQVGGDVIRGSVYGLFETPWVLVADVSEEVVGVGEQPLLADIELASNRLTMLLHDPAGERYKLIVTHPQGVVTSARIYGVNGYCSLGMELDPTTSSYRVTAGPTGCTF